MSMTTTDRPCVIVSADTHIGPGPELFRPYCPKEYLEGFDAWAAALREKAQASGGQLGFAGMARSGDWRVSRRNLETPGHFDMEARLRDLDADGVAGQVIFHDSQNGYPLPFDTTTIFTRDALDFEGVKAGQDIYNRWLADQITIQPERHVALCYVPTWDIDEAVRRVEWAAANGFKGVNFPYPRPYMKSYNNPEWEPFFAAVVANEMVLCHHGGGAPTATGGPGAMSIVKLEVANMSRISPLSHLIFGGVFERHPGLRLVLTESVGPWWAHVMRELDSVYIHDVAEYPEIGDLVRKLPSEYATEQVFIGASFLARFEIEDAIENDYLGNVIWGSDYPHFEGTYQLGITTDGDTATRAALRFTVAGFPEPVIRQVLGSNAVHAYRMDGEAIQEVANRIAAPTFEELSRPLSELPDPHDRGHHSYRTFGFWA